MRKNIKLNTDYLKRVATALLLGITSVALIAYVSYHLWRTFTSEVTTITAVKSTVTITSRTMGYIMRDETIVRSSVSGNVIPVISDGEKVGTKSLIAQIYDSGTKATADRIKEIDGEIALLKESLSDGTLSLYDSSSIDSAIISLMHSLSAANNAGDHLSALSLRSELKEKLIKRTLLSSTTAKVENMISDLTSERTKLKKDLGTCRDNIYSPLPGYYYLTTDGYEKIFTSKAALSLTPEIFSEMISSSPDTSLISETSGKIATGYVWYLACTTDPQETGKISAGDIKSVSFPYNSGITLEMKAERVISYNSSNEVLVVFSCDRIPPGFDFTRAQPIEILKAEYECFKIPVSAIRVNDGQRGVYVLHGSTVLFRAVSVITQIDDVYLADIYHSEDPQEYRWLDLNDRIIVEGTGLYHGRILS